MTTPNNAASADEQSAAASAARHDAIYPRAFSSMRRAAADDLYLNDPSTLKLVQFFEGKTLAAIKQEDQREQWYEDWLAYQAEHRLYASVLSPGRYSTLGFEFDLLRYARFLEVFAYFSPAHGYSLQVTFLGLFAILMGSNTTLKQEAVAALEKGRLLAFGVSEKTHGSDLFANEFRLTETGPGRFMANGTKYYIGNSNAAAILSILAKRDDARTGDSTKRFPFALLALRPEQSRGFRNVGKIRTLGVRAGYVGEFEVKNHELPESDLIAEKRQAWDAVLGTVTLGKFFLGFGSIGICEHAFEEAADHLGARILYGKPVIEMPHIRSTMAQAYARITAMKLYAYRALDYVQAACAADRRYLLFCAVQKAKVSTEGVRAMALLSECIGAKGFEADTYFEMALRDAQLIPSLESSAHVNLGFTAHFCSRYFGRFDPHLADPKSLVAGEILANENPYLMEARTGGIGSIAFPPYLGAYRPLQFIPNVRLFARQVKRFRLFLLANRAKRTDVSDMQYALTVGECLATIAYAQLIAENAKRLDLAPEMISVIFCLLVSDLSAAALTLASLPQLDAVNRFLLRRMVTVPQTGKPDWDFVAARMDAR
ncbi:MAG: acyl-CoA dehydrogenase family protein [Planctomycetota bacterium]|jgi:acyl-CoA dehydrogenase